LAKSLAGRRSSTREKDVSGAKSKKAAALAALKKQRKVQQEMEESSSESDIDFDDSDEDSDEDYEEAGLKPWQKKGKKAAKATVSRLEEEEEEDEMEIDEEKPSEKARKLREERSRVIAEATVEDFQKVTIPRRRLARWCNEPFFMAAVLECFVRLFIGEDDNGEKVYRLCEVVDVKETNKTLKFPATNRNEAPVTTNKMLRLKFGNSERDFPMYLVSDAPPTEMDFQKYITTQKNNRAEVLSKRRANKLRRLQDELVSNYTYTTEDIERNVRQRKKQGKSLAKLGLEQTRATIAVQAARDAVAEAEQRLSEAKKTLMEFSGPAYEEEELQTAVDEDTKELEAAKKDLDEKLEEERMITEAAKERKDKLTRRSKEKNWSKVNERAIQMNRGADREAYRAQKEAEARKAAGQKEEFNPYARRRVKPKVLWKVSGREEEETKAEEKKESRDDTAKDESTTTTTTTTTNEMATPSLVQETEKTTALSERHQFAIDEEDLAQSSVGLGLGGRKMAAKKNRVRKGLSLTEYLERKENGTL
jgi:RNA polymerase-associated protein RTF1